MSTLPPGWTTAAIRLLCTLENGRAFKPSDWTQNGLPIVRIQNLNRPGASFNHFAGEVDDRYRLRGGELLFAWSGTPGTSFGAHVWRGGDAVLNQHIFRVDFDPSVVEKRFFRHAINQKLEELIDVAHGGVGLRHVTKGVFENTAVLVPPLGEQKRIADKLDALLARVDACRERLDRVPAILTRFRQSVLAAATSGELTCKWREARGLDDAVQSFQLEDAEAIRDYSFPASWTIRRLADIATISGGITKDSKKQAAGFVELPYLRVANVQRGYLDLSEVKTIRVPPDRVSDLLLRAGDILFNEGGDIDKLGRGWIWSDELPTCAFQNHVFRARLLDPTFEPRYFSWYGNSRGHEYFLARGKQTTNLASINKSVLSALPVAVPPADEQEEIVRRTNELLQLADSLRRRCGHAATRVAALTPSALTKAFRGELVEQDPNDEPATAVLTRLASPPSAGPRSTSATRSRRGGRTATSRERRRS